MNDVARTDPASASLALVTIPSPGDSARRYARASKSDGTLRPYGSALCSFEAWRCAHHLQAVAADVTTVVDFLSAEADAGRKVSSIAQKAAAIRWAHKTAGLPSPTDAEAVQKVMRGIRREVGVAPVQKQPATPERILTMIAHVPDTMAASGQRLVDRIPWQLVSHGVLCDASSGRDKLGSSEIFQRLRQAGVRQLAEAEAAFVAPLRHQHFQAAGARATRPTDHATVGNCRTPQNQSQ